LSEIKVGWVEGSCPSCGRVWRRKIPANPVICDCYMRCPNCGRDMVPYSADLNPLFYRSEDRDDPTGTAEKHEATAETRYYCPDCDHYSDGVPIEVDLG